MNERLLQFIWQFQYFNRNELATVSGEPLQIIAAGQYNRDQGPDFSNAKIKIGTTTWAGTIELHLRTSDWKKHKHQQDRNYENVILHVVWQHDLLINDIPVLELNGRVSRILLERYEQLLHASTFIPCEKMINTINDLTWKSWKDRLLAERLARKAARMRSYLEENNPHWEELCWWMLARNFGYKVNAAAFEEMARSLPLNILAKHRMQIHQLEALLFGQAGLLAKKIKDGYYEMLQKEYRFLRDKYRFRRIHQPIHFLRMRPGNFPTIRLAQLAMLVHTSSDLFSRIRDTIDPGEIRKMFDVTANDHWHYHYRFEDESAFKKKNLGESMIDNIIINTIAPLLFAYGSYHNDDRYRNRALDWMEQTAAEHNSITKGFEQLGIENKSAYDSQALTELKNEYCNAMRCLECGVGNVLLKT